MSAGVLEESTGAIRAMDTAAAAMPEYLSGSAARVAGRRRDCPAPLLMFYVDVAKDVGLACAVGP